MLIASTSHARHASNELLKCRHTQKAIKHCKTKGDYPKQQLCKARCHVIQPRATSSREGKLEAHLSLSPGVK